MLYDSWESWEYIDRWMMGAFPWIGNPVAAGLVVEFVYRLTLIENPPIGG